MCLFEKVHSRSPEVKQPSVPADQPAQRSGWSSHVQAAATAELGGRDQATAPCQPHANSWDTAAFPWGVCRISQLFLESLLQQLPGKARRPRKLSTEHLTLRSKAHLLLAESSPHPCSRQRLGQLLVQA